MPFTVPTVPTVPFVPDRGLVRLRPLAEDDVDDILTWVNDPAIVGNIAAFSGEPFTQAQELAYVKEQMASKTDRVFSVFATKTGDYVGQVGIHQIHWRSRVGRLGVIIAKRGQMGRGLGSAAIAHALDHAFAVEDLHKMWLMVFSTNERSLRTYERLGFQREGVLREEYFHDGGWHHMVRLSMLAREWVYGSANEEGPA